MKKYQIKKIVLLILDGWGLGKEDSANAIYLAKTPFIDSLYKKWPWTKLCSSGNCVGLPPNQVGNSEAGHENMGAGRKIDQDVVAISRDINTGRFAKNAAYLSAINHIKKNKSNLHIMGMLSNGQSPHSDPDHLLALICMARRQKIKKIYIHLFTDGRDSPPRNALKSIEALERFLKPNEIIATVIGRFYAMDRKKAWERTLLAYDAMTGGVNNPSIHTAKSPQEGITRAYNADITDEFIEPIVMKIKGRVAPRIKDNDAVIFFNLRSDRARQMTKPFVQKDFEKMNPNAIPRKSKLKNLFFVAMTDFGPDLDSILTAYPSVDLKDTLPILLSEKKQVYIAENEKFAHITYFFNGGYSDIVAGEKRVLVPSPKVKSYDIKPAMSTAKICNKVISNFKTNDFILANIACPDMIGHTGNIEAGIKAAEAVDKYVKKIANNTNKKDSVLIITADHGNLEYMKNIKTGEIVTEHTTNPVPFILVGKDVKNKKLSKKGVLGDIAPTVMELFGMSPSGEMKGSSLLK